MTWLLACSSLENSLHGSFMPILQRGSLRLSEAEDRPAVTRRGETEPSLQVALAASGHFLQIPRVSLPQGPYTPGVWNPDTGYGLLPPILVATAPSVSILALGEPAALCAWPQVCCREPRGAGSGTPFVQMRTLTRLTSSPGGDATPARVPSSQGRAVLTAACAVLIRATYQWVPGTLPQALPIFTPNYLNNLGRCYFLAPILQMSTPRL